MNGHYIEKVIIDNKAIVNTLPSRVLKMLGKEEKNLLPIDVTVGNFIGNNSSTKRVISIQLQVGSRVTKTNFFVIDIFSKYNVLLGRGWIHVHGCVPSSLHQVVIFLTKSENGTSNEMKIALSDDNPCKADTNNVEVDLYSWKVESIEMTNIEVKVVGIGITDDWFHTYIKEGLQQLSKDLEKLNILQKGMNSHNK